ncbi:MAG: hypothetical protein JXR83_02325 [Deltaproteobacteria bacterium]|nr:hypothetical protein [Deltaproteobacteria bacterium]
MRLCPSCGRVAYSGDTCLWCGASLDAVATKRPAIQERAPDFSRIQMPARVTSSQQASAPSETAAPARPQIAPPSPPVPATPPVPGSPSPLAAPPPAGSAATRPIAQPIDFSGLAPPPIVGTPPPAAAPAAGAAEANATLDSLFADLGLGKAPAAGSAPVSIPQQPEELSIEIDFDGKSQSPAPPAASVNPVSVEGYLPDDFEFPEVKTPLPQSRAEVAPPPPPPPPPPLPAAPAAPAAPIEPPQAADPRHELEMLSRLAGGGLAQELCRIARDLEAQGRIPDAVRIWRAAQLLDPLSNDAALALVRLTS